MIMAAIFSWVVTYNEKLPSGWSRDNDLSFKFGRAVSCNEEVPVIMLIFLSSYIFISTTTMPETTKVSGVVT